MDAAPKPSNLILQYQRVSDYYGGPGEVETTVDTLAEALCCTRRNVNIILQKMTQQGWIRWHPSRGRGRQSRLELLQNGADLNVQLAIQRAESGHLADAFDGLGGPQERAALLTYLRGQLGFSGHQGGAKHSLRIPYHRPIRDLNPAGATRVTEIHMVRQVFDGLVRFESSSGQVRPQLAHHWRADSDHSCWDFFLRPEVQFHHGRNLESKDVAATLEHLKEAPGQYQQLYQQIDSVHCPTALSIRVRLSQPNRLFLHLMSHHSALIQAHEYLPKSGARHQPVGTGAFRVSHNDDFQLLLSAHPQYFRERALLDEIAVWVFDNEKVPLPDTPDVYFTDTQLPDNPELHHNQKIEKGYQYLLFNVANGDSAMQDMRIRRCIRSMLDPVRLVRELGGSRAEPARRLLPEWEQGRQRLMFPVRPRMPMRLNRPLKLYTYDVHMEDAQWIKATLQGFEIGVQICQLSYADYSDPKNWRDADLVLSGEALDEDLQMALYEWFATQRSLRHCMGRERRQQVDAMLAQLLGQPTQAERLDQFHAIDVYLQQQLVLMPLYHHQQLMHYGDRVQGLNLNSLGWVDFKDIYLS